MAIQRVEVKNPVGVNTSVGAADLPPSVWSNALNVYFKNGRSFKSQGYTSIFGTPPANILRLTQQIDIGQLYWYEMTPTKIFRTTGTTHTDLSKPATTYAATEDTGWTSGVLNGVVYCNNPNDKPQIKRQGDATFIDLPNWTSTDKALVMRTYKNYMVALGVTRSGAEIPTVVKWSAPADPGQVPSTWDVADPTNDAGEATLSGTGDAIIDGLKLRDSFIIYKSGSVHSMNYVGGTFVFSFRQLFDDIGIIGRDAVAEFDGKHFVVGRGDVYVHNGVQKSSVIDGKMRNYFFSNIRNDASDRTFVVPDYNNTSMWICYCSSDRNDASLKGCNKALVWNWIEDTWSVRELPNIRYAAFGIVDPQLPNDWDSNTQSWNTDTTAWGERMYNPSKVKVIMSSVETDKVYVVGNTTVYDNASFKSVLERVGVSLGDDRGIKTITSITPHIAGGGTMNIYVGASYIQDGPITWKGPYSYTIGSQFKTDFKLSGRYLAVRFEVDSSANWTLSGYTLEVAPQGGLR